MFKVLQFYFDNVFRTWFSVLFGLPPFINLLPGVFSKFFKIDENNTKDLIEQVSPYLWVVSILLFLWLHIKAFKFFLKEKEDSEIAIKEMSKKLKYCESKKEINTKEQNGEDGGGITTNVTVGTFNVLGGEPKNNDKSEKKIGHIINSDKQSFLEKITIRLVDDNKKDDFDKYYVEGYKNINENINVASSNFLTAFMLIINQKKETIFKKMLKDYEDSIQDYNFSYVLTKFDELKNFSDDSKMDKNELEEIIRSIEAKLLSLVPYIID